MYTCQVIEIRHELFRQYSYYGVITYVNMRIILDIPPHPRVFVNRLQQLSPVLYYIMREGLVHKQPRLCFFNHHVRDDKIQ